jgi:UDP-N-acetylglucosamine acyltransferase
MVPGDAPLTILIHPTAVIHPGAKLHPSVRVGPYAVVGEYVKIGPETQIGAHVVLDGYTEIGARNQIFPGAAIGLESQDRKFDGSLNLVKIGDDNRIREYVTINRASQTDGMTVIGNGNLLLAYVHIAHDCRIEDQVTIANAVSLGGHIHIESQATVGGVVGIHQFVHIGRLAMIGGMSRIDRDVPPYMLVEGNPSRVRALNQVGLKRAGFDKDDEQILQSLKKAFKILYRSSLTLNQALEQLDLLPDHQPVQHLRRFLQLSQAEGRRGPIPGRRLNHEF